MGIRLNKFISDTGLCSRREADRYIEEGRILVNSHVASAGVKLVVGDVVRLDEVEFQVRREDVGEDTVEVTPKSQKVTPFNQRTLKKVSSVTADSSNKKRGEASAQTGGKKGGLRPGKYVKYNKYAAARHAAREAAKRGESTSKVDYSEQDIKKAMQPGFGKSLSRSAVAQRLVASPKSAALRKTSRNNPANKAKRAAQRNNQRNA